MENRKRPKGKRCRNSKWQLTLRHPPPADLQSGVMEMGDQAGGLCKVPCRNPDSHTGENPRRRRPRRQRIQKISHHQQKEKGKTLPSPGSQTENKRSSLRFVIRTPSSVLGPCGECWLWKHAEKLTLMALKHRNGKDQLLRGHTFRWLSCHPPR